MTGEETDNRKRSGRRTEGGGGSEAEAEAEARAEGLVRGGQPEKEGYGNWKEGRRKKRMGKRTGEGMRRGGQDGKTTRGCGGGGGQGYRDEEKGWVG